MKKLLAVGVLLSVIGSPSSSGAALHPQELTFYLHCEESDPTSVAIQFFMDTTDSDDPVSPCGSDLQVGLDNQITIGWPARDGVPFILDAGKDVSGTIELRGLFVDSTPSVKLVGTVGQQKITLGSAEGSPIVGPSASFDFAIPLADSLNRKKLTGLSLITTLRGTMHSPRFEVDAPSSSITMPIFHSGKMPKDPHADHDH